MNYSLGNNKFMKIIEGIYNKINTPNKSTFDIYPIFRKIIVGITSSTKDNIFFCVNDIELAKTLTKFLIFHISFFISKLNKLQTSYLNFIFST